MRMTNSLPVAFDEQVNGAVVLQVRFRIQTQVIIALSRNTFVADETTMTTIQ